MRIELPYVLENIIKSNKKRNDNIGLLEDVNNKKIYSIEEMLERELNDKVIDTLFNDFKRDNKQFKGKAIYKDKFMFRLYVILIITSELIENNDKWE